MNKFLFVLFLVSTHNAYASKNFVDLKSKEKINAVLSAIPAGKINLAQRLNELGLEPSTVALSEADDSDINDGSSTYQKGDKFVDIYLKTPITTNPKCDLFPLIKFKVRKGNYLPESKASNFLLTGKCSLK